MTINTLELWHQTIDTKNIKNLDILLAEQVVLYSPVLHTPQKGKILTKMYLSDAFYVFVNNTFKYVREVSNGNDIILEFEVVIDDIVVNGVDMMKVNDEGQITEFRVMIRPLKALNLIDRKSTRLKSSHITTSYAVFCLKKQKKKKQHFETQTRTTTKYKYSTH